MACDGTDGCIGWCSEPGECGGPAVGCASSECEEGEPDSSPEQLAGVHGVSTDDSDAVSDSRSKSMDAFCGYEEGRKALVDVNWAGP